MALPPLFSEPDTFHSVASTSQHGPLAPPSSFQILSAPPLHPDILSQLLLHIPPTQPTLHTASPHCLFDHVVYTVMLRIHMTEAQQSYRMNFTFTEVEGIASLIL